MSWALGTGLASAWGSLRHRGRALSGGARVAELAAGAAAQPPGSSSAGRVDAQPLAPQGPLPLPLALQVGEPGWPGQRCGMLWKSPQQQPDECGQNPLDRAAGAPRGAFLGGLSGSGGSGSGMPGAGQTPALSL